MVPTSIKVSAVLNWPVLRKCSAIVRSREAFASGEENKGEYVGRGVWNFCKNHQYDGDISSSTKQGTLSNAFPILASAL